MRIIESIEEMQELARVTRNNGKRIVLVPTMGYLHAGHASLMEEGRKLGDLLVASIFVNPTQFGAGEDFDAYPRDFDRDLRCAAAAGVDVIFMPKTSAMYPAEFQTWVNIEKITLPLCGGSRPGHFRGVTTVVCKLLNIVMSHTAIFGKKDYQQLAVIRRMVADLNIPTEIVGMPILREQDGLAMSSRNVYLSPVERQRALCLSHALNAARELYLSGKRDIQLLRQQVTDIILVNSTVTIEYVDFRDGDTLEEVIIADDHTLLALAIKIGKTRLIDNRLLGEDR